VLALWSSQTAAGVLCGMLYGGYTGLVEARRAPEADVATFKNRRHRAATYFVRGSILQGARIGAFVAVLAGAAAAITAVREDSHASDGTTMAAAAAATCAVFGGAVGGLRAAAQAAAFGGAVGGVAGYGEAALERALLGEGGLSRVNEEAQRAKDNARRREIEEARGAAEEILTSLERGQRERSVLLARDTKTDAKSDG
jgi:hypothetical protein